MKKIGVPEINIGFRPRFAGKAQQQYSNLKHIKLDCKCKTYTKRKPASSIKLFIVIPDLCRKMFQGNTMIVILTCNKNLKLCH